MGRLFDFMLPDNKSPLTADSTDGLFHFINEASLVSWAVLAMIYFAIRYKRNRRTIKLL